ncbi:MAG: SAM-dependent DNA methyltransferase [Candidatus Tectomicrobia bacterium]|nr:SAM-dependent DNA methyltransferase [Candidatus Tectomicrobia bacterium]
MSVDHRKAFGQFYTPDFVARSLVAWAIRTPHDRMLDPSCGDGRFLRLHRRSVGVEQDPQAHSQARAQAPWALIHEGDFFSWARETEERFDAAVGNPPFIRYQRFSGETRRTALDLCRSLGADFSALTSSWAPFLVAAAALLKPGGRLAFVIPAEIGHAPYARPLLDYLLDHFRFVQVIAVRKKLFPNLSEDAWLLYANGYAEARTTCELRFTTTERFQFLPLPPATGQTVSRTELELWRGRLRPFLLPRQLRKLYQRIAKSSETIRLGSVARIGIGYVTGANNFFHLRPSTARQLGIPTRLLQPTVRAGRLLPRRAVTNETVCNWIDQDEQTLLLRLDRSMKIPRSVIRYLDSAEGLQAREAYKCRNRNPWYSVPNVTIPDGFLSYMSSRAPSLVANLASCACTNSVHAIQLRTGADFGRLQRNWSSDLVALSSELEGHPLGGGVLKVEPGEATRILVPLRPLTKSAEIADIREGVGQLRSWRHRA